MELVNQIRGNFPKTIDKSKPIFSAIVANDEGNAAIQKQLVDLLDYMKEWISTPDIYNQSGLMLDKTVRFFSFLEKFTDETETSLKNRFKAIFVRNHDSRWGTPFDVKQVFKQYFPHAEIYLVENVNKIDAAEAELANLIQDGDIATDTPTDWSLTNCTAVAEARFSKSYGIKMDQAGGILTPSQSILISGSSCYFLHFFMKGKVNVVIENNAHKFWNNTTKEWADSEVKNTFSTSEWNNISLYFISESTNSSVNISFEYVDTLTYLDYFRLFKKQPYSSFTVIAHFVGSSAVGAFGLAAGDDDPNTGIPLTDPLPQPRYSNYGYYDKSFLFGVPIGFASDIYEDLLDYLRSQGVRAFLEIVIKDADEP